MGDASHMTIPSFGYFAWLHRESTGVTVFIDDLLHLIITRRHLLSISSADMLKGKRRILTLGGAVWDYTSVLIFIQAIHIWESSMRKAKGSLKKKLPNDWELISETLNHFRTEIEGIVVESTYNWY